MFRKRIVLVGLGVMISALSNSLYADNRSMIEGSAMNVLERTPEASTGINTIYIVYNTEGCSLVYRGSDCMNATVQNYSNYGISGATDVLDIDRTVSSLTIPDIKGDTGYIITEEGSLPYVCWIVDYSKHRFDISGIDLSPDNDCSYTILDAVVSQSSNPIEYFTPNGGQKRELSREIQVDYTTQEYDSEAKDFVKIDAQKVYSNISNRITITPPVYYPTYYTITGDQFLEEWGEGIKIESNVFEPIAVDSRTEAVQEESSSDEASNIIHGSDNGLGGSAPSEITFYAYTTEGVIDNEWQMSREQDFENPEYRFKVRELSYTFDQEGTYYLRYVGSNFDGSCVTEGDVYTVTIGGSELVCPNAFSPNDDGVNDVWKVSYRSLIEFHCEIFNRNGQKIFGFDDPSQGWDGTWHGKKVKPGVYYYVIVATGADGQKYKKSGDINIINFTNPVGTGTGGGGESDFTE